ncbi:uncharacterized protein LOC113294391 [Papaver somniferum]|uniref:uncharacterized protein LOC113294391 n=1 Tax=Papaver somniferum TaxID=3469 RepID=UPI000E700E3A|nr:uncharacterized protein LOC113294391 [Papaver somniferum]
MKIELFSVKNEGDVAAGNHEEAEKWDVFDDGSSKKEIRQELLMIDIKLAKGVVLPIGSLFLGSLYTHLDHLVADMRVSNGYMKVESYVHVAFLQAWLWEHFEKYALKPLSSLPASWGGSRILRWGFGSVNAFTALARRQEITPLPIKAGSVEPSRKESEKQKSLEDEGSSSHSSTGSSSGSGSEGSEEGYDSGDDSEIEACEDFSLAAATAIGASKMEVDQTKGMDAARTTENAMTTVNESVEENPFPAVGMVAGATFDPPYLVPYPGHVLVGGFSVLAKYKVLYTKIWERYVHIATTRKITSRFALVKRVEEALSSIEDMCEVTGHTVSEDVIVSWKYHRDMCIENEFNASWFVKGFAEIQKLKTVVAESLSTYEIAQQEA